MEAHKKWKKIIQIFEPKSALIVSMHRSLQQKKQSDISKLDSAATVEINKALHFYYNRSVECRDKLLYKEKHSLDLLDKENQAHKVRFSEDKDLLMKEYGRSDTFSGGVDTITNFMTDVNLLKKQEGIMMLKDFSRSVEKLFEK